jgi:uncharacterized protein RhaS with RHS repeats
MNMSIGGFRTARGGGVSARFEATEAMLLRSLVNQVAELVGGEDLLPDEPGPGGESAQDTEVAALEQMFALSDSAGLPDDPVLARLLPDAYRDDEAASDEFRRYTEHGLRAGKVASAAVVLATLPEEGGRVRLTEEQAQSWLRALNDVRLALGVRLDVTEDRDEMLAQVEADSSKAAGLWVYDWLSVLLETLVEALW